MECLQRFEADLEVLSESEREGLVEALKVFIGRCCDVSWSMILQRPMLTICPSEQTPKERVLFEEERHSRVLGSNKRDQHILYFVWPGIAQNDVALDNVKVYVLQRDEPFPQNKK